MRGQAWRRLAALALLLWAWSAPVHAHGGRPVAIAREQVAGPYLVSLWATTDVGDGMVYVVLTPRAGVSFQAPAMVQLAVRAAADTAFAAPVHAHAEPVAHGARYVAHVPLRMAGPWVVQATLDGAAGHGVVQAQFTVEAPGAMGAAGMLFYLSPFILVAGLGVRAWLARRQHAGTPLAALTSP